MTASLDAPPGAACSANAGRVAHPLPRDQGVAVPAPPWRHEPPKPDNPEPAHTPGDPEKDRAPLPQPGRSEHPVV